MFFNAFLFIFLKQTFNALPNAANKRTNEAAQHRHFRGNEALQAVYKKITNAG